MWAARQSRILRLGASGKTRKRLRGDRTSQRRKRKATVERPTCFEHSMVPRVSSVLPIEHATARDSMAQQCQLNEALPGSYHQWPKVGKSATWIGRLSFREPSTHM